MHTRTIAGRHAADQQRARDRAEREEQQAHARTELDRTFRSLGLTTHPHFDPELETERSLWVNCRLSHPGDHELAYAVLDNQGWRPDRTRLSRIRQSHDVLRLVHQQTGAILVVIIKVPFARPEPLEAA